MGVPLLDYEICPEGVVEVRGRKPRHPEISGEKKVITVNINTLCPHEKLDYNFWQLLGSIRT